MFASNQQRLRSYVSERRVEEATADAQQERLYEQLAIERGELDQVSSLARMAKRVINTFGDEIMMPSAKLAKTNKMAATDYIAAAIQNRTLSKLLENITNLDAKTVRKMGKQAYVIWEDLKNPASGVKDTTNAAILEIMKSNADINTKNAAVLDAIHSNVAGGFIEVLNKMAATASQDKSHKKDQKSKGTYEFNSPELKHLYNMILKDKAVNEAFDAHGTDPGFDGFSLNGTDDKNKPFTIKVEGSNVHQIAEWLQALYNGHEETIKNIFMEIVPPSKRKNVQNGQTMITKILKEAEHADKHDKAFFSLISYHIQNAYQDKGFTTGSMSGAKRMKSEVG